MDIGRSLHGVKLPLPLEVRCAADVADSLAAIFPPGAAFHTPISSSRPRWIRIAYQQMVAPLVDRRSTILVSIGDQAPTWGRSPLIFAVNDIRRLTRPDTVSGRLEGVFYRLVLRRGTRRARSILTISRFSRDQIRETLDPSCPLSVVASRLPLQIDPIQHNRAMRLVTVSALRKYKGHETLLEAVAKLQRRGRNSFEVICVGGEEAGDGRRRELCERAAQLGISERVRFLGWVPDETLEGLFSSCLATINPSTYEGYGLPVAESIFRGLPTIASDIPPHREVGGDAAIYFEPGDPSGLAKAIESVTEDPGLCERLALAARSRGRVLAAERPSWGEAIAAALDALEDSRPTGATSLFQKALS